jgi:hypothetical protein
MHLSFLASYWWIVLAAMVAVFLGFVFVAGRTAEGGLGNRARLGWSRWRSLSRKAGELQARIILTVFYFTAAVPFGLSRTHFADTLDLKHTRRDRRWHDRATRDLTLDDARRQF